MSTPQSPTQLKKYATDSLYGIINGVMCIPVSISFCSIIYRDSAFTPHLPSLVKLVLLSSTVHQLMFTFCSSLPFAVGQVQDAGLIFLSAMAGDIVSKASPDRFLATTIVILPICTMLLGFFLIVIGKLRLASVVQYLPMPVIGGYLAFIGFFCGEAALGMMAGINLVTLQDWSQLMLPRNIMLVVPGVIVGVSIYATLRTVRSPLALPACLGVVLIVFFSILFFTGTTLQEARDLGWVAPLVPPAPFYEMWSLYDFNSVDWRLLPAQWLRLAGMCFVVAFSSSLDVAAIEMELGMPLNYNWELQTVGWSNVASGLTGGYTGSYIFTQTIFSMRRGVTTKASGLVMSLVMFLVVLMPVSVISFLPKLFFGSLLVLISTDMMLEWLIESRHKMMPVEYGVCLFTFLAIKFIGIEAGMVIGILSAMTAFVVSYSTVPSVSVSSSKHSTVTRTFEERDLLISQRHRLVTVSLSGYIFFGSALKILAEVKQLVQLPTDDENNEDNDSAKDKHGDVCDAVAGSEYRIVSMDGDVEMANLANSFDSNVTDERTRLRRSGSSLYSDPSSGNNLSRSRSESNNDPLLSLSVSTVQTRTMARWVWDSLSWSSVQDSPQHQHQHQHHDTSNVYELSAEEIVTQQAKWAKKLQSTSPVLGQRNPRGRSTSMQRDDAVEDTARSAPAPTSQPSMLQAVWESQKSSPPPSASSPTDGLSVNPVDGVYQVLLNQPSASAVNAKEGELEYLLLDFSAVVGVDATAARSCFLMIAQLMRTSGVRLIFAQVSEPVLELLRAHQVIHDTDIVIPLVDDALEWCEEQILGSLRKESQQKEMRRGNRDSAFYATASQRRHRHGSTEATPPEALTSADSPRQSTSLSALRRILEDYLEVEGGSKNPVRALLQSQMLSKYFTRVEYKSNATIFEPGQTAIQVFILEDGEVEVVKSSDYDRTGQSSESTVSTSTESSVVRINKFTPGCVFGEPEFFLKKTYSVKAFATCESVMWTLDLQGYARMEVEQPHLFYSDSSSQLMILRAQLILLNASYDNEHLDSK